MDALLAEVARKRKAKAAEFGGQKYARVTDVDKLREAPQRPPDAVPADAAAGSTALPAAAPASAALPPDLVGLTGPEAVRRLRALGHPATLFGETDADRLQRLALTRQLAAAQPQPEEAAATAQQKDERGEALRRMAKQQQQQQGLALPPGPAAAAAGAADAGGGGASAAPASAAEAAAASFRSAAAAVAAQRAHAALPRAERVAARLRGLADEWLAETEGRAGAAPEWAGSAEGRNAVTTARLTRDHLRPLLRLLRRGQCAADIERALWLIVQAVERRNYKEAGDLYVRVAIGNAAWPIGVTMVGIHERSAREKISASGTAHVMHDEQTRKYLQAVKRLVTYAQRRYPSTPSLSLEFDSGVNGSDKEALLAAEGAAACGAAPPLMIEAPGAAAAGGGAGGAGGGGPGGGVADGWRANDGDIRTWKSIMRKAAADER